MSAISAAMLLTAKPMHEPILRLPFSSPNSVRLQVSAISTRKTRNFQTSVICCSNSSTTASSSSPPVTATNAAPVQKKRKRYRKLYPGESIGITEEMRFVAMRLRNINGKKYSVDEKSNDDVDRSNSLETSNGGDNGSEDNAWQPSMEGFLKYLVDSKLIFNTVERIVDESGDVSYAYFRKNGLERSEGLSKDLEWFIQEGHTIPEPSSPGLSYAKYLEEVAESSAPLFLCHLYNIYFSHIAGGQVIARQVSKNLLERKELEFYRWEGDASELLKGVREKLNMLGEHWTRDEKNKCLKETTKSFRFMGQIVRLIIL